MLAIGAISNREIAALFIWKKGPCGTRGGSAIRSRRFDAGVASSGACMLACCNANVVVQQGKRLRAVAFLPDLDLT